MSAAAFLAAAIAFSSSAAGQSVNQSFPTPISESEISGVINARDVGDARLTTYYYVFEAVAGDVFINVSTTNFNGDIDIFSADGLRPLSKIVVYADFAENETGRAIYIRRPEKLLLRIQGRSPSDQPSTYKIKFAGSFVAAADKVVPPEPELPTAAVRNDTGIRVNSVGTIIEKKAKPKPVEKAAAPAVETNRRRAEQAAPESPSKIVRRKDNEIDSGSKDEREEAKAAIAPRKKGSDTAAERRSRSRRPASIKNPPKTSKASQANSAPGDAAPDPLANIRLSVQFKDGKLIERPMNEVFKFSVDKGVLTIINRDGTVGRYSILEIERVTIQ